MKTLLAVVSLGLLVLAAPARAQIDLDYSASWALPAGHSYFIGLTPGTSNTLLLHTRSEAWQSPAYDAGPMSWTKVFDPTLSGVVLSEPSFVAQNANASGRFFYTGGFAPTLYDFRRSPPSYTAATQTYSYDPAALLSTTAGVYFARSSNDNGGIDFFADPASTPTTTTPNFVAGSQFSALALGPDGMLYALDADTDHIRSYHATTGASVSEFEIAPGITAGTFAISSMGLLFAADFVGGQGYIYDTATGNLAGHFDLPVDINAPMSNLGKPSMLIMDNTLYATSGSGANLYIYDLGVIPEPSVTTLLIGGGALLMAFIHRRKR
jgi:outer membrane protein assembly factor BamB